MSVKARAMSNEHKLERRHQILDGVERLFLAAQPIGSWSMDDLATATGVAKGTLYLYFPSKEEALLAAHERSLHRVFDELDKALENKSTLTFDEMGQSARKLFIDNPLYLPLATLAISFVSHAVAVETVMRVHASIGERIFRTGTGFERALGLPPGEGVRFLEYTHALVLGLWQVTGCGRLVPDDAKAADPNLSVFIKREPAEYRRALNALWTGLLSETQNVNAAKPRANAKIKTKIKIKTARRTTKSRTRK